MLSPAAANRLIRMANRDQRSRLQAGYDVAQARLSRAWNGKRRSLAAAWSALQAKAAEPTMSRDALRATAEYGDVRAKVREAVDQYAPTVRSVATATEDKGRTAGRQFAYNAIMQTERPSDLHVSMDSVPRYTASAAFLLTVAGLAAGIVAGMEDKWRQAQNGGYSPSWVARQMRDYVDTMPITAGLNVSRTAQLFGARRTALHTYKRNGVERWIWSASLDGLVCGFCVAMHGSVHSVEEELTSHHNCRCSPVPVTPSWGDLGFSDGEDVQIETGERWLREQPYAVWERILGKAGAAAYADGAFTLPDVVGSYDDDIFGHMGKQRSLVEILGEQLADAYKRRIA